MRQNPVEHPWKRKFLGYSITWHKQARIKIADSSRFLDRPNMLLEEFDYKASFGTFIRSAGRTSFHSIASMPYFTKLFMAVFCAVTLHATAADELVARTMAGKDYQTSLEKIRADELAAFGDCAKEPGPAANACMVQANGKRIRAEQEAKEKMDRIGKAAPLPDAQTKAASTTAVEAAKTNRSTTGKSIDAETKIARTECRKLSGDQRKTCIEDVAKRIGLYTSLT